jgi:hypothetical protein
MLNIINLTLKDPMDEGRPLRTTNSRWKMEPLKTRGKREDRFARKMEETSSLFRLPSTIYHLPFITATKAVGFSFHA